MQLIFSIFFLFPKGVFKRLITTFCMLVGTMRTLSSGECRCCTHPQEMGNTGSYCRPYLCSGRRPSRDHCSRIGPWPQHRGEQNLSSSNTGGTHSRPSTASDTLARATRGHNNHAYLTRM